LDDASVHSATLFDLLQHVVLDVISVYSQEALAWVYEARVLTAALG
jgi:hypothetical protein